MLSHRECLMKTITESIEENSFNKEKLNLNKINIIGFRIINASPIKHSTSIHIVRVPKNSTVDCKSSSIILKSKSINVNQNRDNIFIKLLKLHVDHHKEEKSIANMMCNIIINVMNTLSNTNDNETIEKLEENNENDKNNVLTVSFEAWSPKKIFEYRTTEKNDQNQFNFNGNFYNNDKELYNEKLLELIKNEKGKNIMIFVSDCKILIDKLNNIQNQPYDENKFTVVPKITVFSASKDVEDEKDMDKLRRRRDSRRPMSILDMERRRSRMSRDSVSVSSHRSRSRESYSSNSEFSPRMDDRKSKRMSKIYMNQMSKKAHRNSRISSNFLTVPDFYSGGYNKKCLKKKIIISEEEDEDDDKPLAHLKINNNNNYNNYICK